MSSASERLARKVELVVPAYGVPGRLLLEHARARELYPAYQATSCPVALVMVPLMEAALARSRELAPADHVAAGLIDYLERHIPEERHGDEPGGDLLADLAALGVDTEALCAGPLSEKVAALIGTQFFRVVHLHPVSILGFLWLETFPPHRATVEQLIERTGLPRAGFRQLLVHSVVDVRHGGELREVIDALPLEPWHEHLIGISALHTIGFLIDAWMDVVGAEVEAPAAAA